MEQLTFVNVILLLMGFLLHVLVSLRKVIRQDRFSLGFWIKDNIVEALISLICGFALLIMSPEIISYFGIKGDDGSPFWMIHSFAICGYMGREAVFKLFNILKGVLVKKES